jgi:hypothetical protein
MSDSRNGFLATFLPFAALALFWEFVVRKNHWGDDANPLKKFVNEALPIFLLVWAITGLSLTYKYASERRELRQLATKARHFLATPASGTTERRVPDDIARQAADKIAFHKLKETIRTIRQRSYDSTHYEAFLKELQTAYGEAGTIRSAPPPTATP